VICILILVLRFAFFPLGINVEEFEPKLPDHGIINIHDHIHHSSDAPKWLDAMEESGISATVMVGSPEATFLLSSPPGFNNYSLNNDVILWLEQKYDSKILAFPTIDPRDPNKLDSFKDLIDRNALGLKLYSGHTGEIFPAPKETLYDYIGPLNRPDMYGVYEYCESNKIPIIWHMKLKWDYLFDEIKEVMNDFPLLIINIPHFGVLGSNLTRLGQLMDTFPGVYTDISFGGFAYWSMQLASNNSEHYSEFITKYHDRVMFGTDMVVTNNVRKTVPWIVNLTLGYRDMLEKDQFYINVPNITGEGFNFDMTLNGFNLSQDILDEIYFENPIRFLSGEPAGKPSSGSRTRTTIDKSHLEIEQLLVFIGDLKHQQSVFQIYSGSI
jgi:predicted TIM-barrel fold metal-dependent hydrolase